MVLYRIVHCAVEEAYSGVMGGRCPLLDLTKNATIPPPQKGKYKDKKWVKRLEKKGTKEKLVQIANISVVCNILAHINTPPPSQPEYAPAACSVEDGEDPDE